MSLSSVLTCTSSVPGPSVLGAVWEATLGHMWPCRSQGWWGTAGWRASGVLLRKRESEGPGAPFLGSEYRGHLPHPAGHRDGVRHLQCWQVTESSVDDSGTGSEQDAQSAHAWKAGQRWGSSERMGKSSHMAGAEGAWETQDRKPAKADLCRPRGVWTLLGGNEEAEEGSAWPQFLAPELHYDFCGSFPPLKKKFFF